MCSRTTPIFPIAVIMEKQLILILIHRIIHVLL